MHYRSKLFLAFFATGLISSIGGGAILFQQMQPFIFQDEQIKAMAVSATTAALINGDLLKQVQSPKDLNSPAFQELQKELQKARDVNRSRHIYINFLYTIRPNPVDKDQFIALVDAETDPKLLSPLGSIDENRFSAQVLAHLDTHYSPDKYISDQWGHWLSGFSPVYDSQGEYVGTVRADIPIDRYLDNLRYLGFVIAVSLLVSVLFALLFADAMARTVTVALRKLMLSVREIGSGNLEHRTALHSGDEFEQLGNEINDMATGLLERERLKMNFARYVSQHVLEKILASETPAKLEGERRKITVLFSDIRQFLQLAETLPAAKVVSLLNEYFEAMLEIIFHYQGTLDKFIADVVMVEFGAPLEDTAQELHAVRAAIDMQKKFASLAQKWQKEGNPLFEMGIGIHTGEAVIGNIGSEQRLSYTAIGDTVNVAARLEQLTKQLKTPILISEATFAGVQGEIKAVCLGPQPIIGRQEPITLYSINL